MEIDRDTGSVGIERYVAVDDCGRIINPMIVEGQVHGGIAQGIAQAFFEHAVYDSNGQLTTGSLKSSCQFSIGLLLVMMIGPCSYRSQMISLRMSNR